jgi:hypothetical protein
MNQYFLATALAVMIVVNDGLAQRATTRVAAPPSSELFQQMRMSNVRQT